MKKNIKIVIAAVLAAACLSGCAEKYEPYSAPTVSSNDFDFGGASAVNEDGASDTSEGSSSGDTVSIAPTVSSDSPEISEPVSSSSTTSTSSSSSTRVSKPIICTVSWNDSGSDTTSSSSSSSNGASNGSTTLSSSGSASETPVSVSNSASAIKAVCGLKSKVETDIGACIVDTYSNHNPYDVSYDYGKDYDAFVSACDWSLVFDADFYAKSFPLLAMQYHDDKALLLEHFQTIGIHEGRQGSTSFNVGVYKSNCGSDIRSAFGDNYEGYYFYYMLNYDSEKSVSTASGSNSKLQQKTIMTALQAAELDGVNMYRREVGVFEIEFDSELAAFAGYRAYLNSHDGWKAHDWFRKDDVVTDYIMDLYDARSIGENTVTNTCRKANCVDYDCTHGGTRYADYRTSESHYGAMISAKNDLIGCGNCYKADGIVSQFDTFINL